MQPAPCPPTCLARWTELTSQEAKRRLAASATTGAEDAAALTSAAKRAWAEPLENTTRDLEANVDKEDSDDRDM